MRTIGIAFVLLVALVSSSCAATATYDVYNGWNLVTAPIVPFNPDPLNVFAGAPDGIDYLLSRNDPSYGSITYDSLDPAGFGNILLGDGFWLYQTQTGTISYDGVSDGVPDGLGVMTDMWISLSGSQIDGLDEGGWHLFGQPFNHDTPVDDGSGTGAYILFTDGTSMKNWADANAAGWVDSFATGNNPSSGAFYVQYDGLGDDDTFRAARGYWLHTYKDNIAMVIPAY